MSKKMLIDAAHPEEVRVALLDQGKVEDFDFESAARKPLRGNIYLARVTRVEPSLQAAFVEYGGNRHGFLAFSEIHPDYYQIPVSDREALQRAEAEVADLAAQLELTQRGDEDDDGDDDNQNDDQPENDASGAAADHSDGNEVNSEADSADDNNKELTAADYDDDNEAGRKVIDDEDEDEEDEEDEEEDVKKSESESSDANSASTPNDQSDDYDPAKIADAEQPFVELDTDTPENGGDPESDANMAQNDEGANGAPEDNAPEEADHDDTDDDNDDDDQPEISVSEREVLFEKYKDAKRKRSNLLRNYKIQEVIKRRQILLIQVVKEERGNKGAALTTYLSLAGRYCVLMPNTARGGGISRKINTSSDRRRLRRVVDSLDVPQGMGLIIRTAGAKRTKTEIKRDYDYLLRLWENIRTLTLKSIAPCLIYEEASLIKRAIRDLYDKDISKVLVEGEAGYREAKDFMKMLMPSHAKHVQPYKEAAPIFLKHNVEQQLDGMYQPSVRLKSGGYLVIHQTEALVAIDVNSGRATRERNIEQTALKTNIEAAHEAARQFRLRDLAGLVVIDFIDMEEPKNNRKVEKALKDALKNDRARIQIGRISNFGLMELSRQRRRSGIVDGTTHSCPTCNGAGVIRSHEMASLRILRAIEGEAISGKVGRIAARTSIDVSLYILNHHRDWLRRIEDANGVVIEVIADNQKAGDDYDLEKSGAPRERVNVAPVIQADQSDMIEPDDEPEEAETDAKADDNEERGSGKKKRRRRRRRKESRSDDQSSEDSNESDVSNDEEASAKSTDNDNDDGSDNDDKPKRRRRRGRRGGRRNKKGVEGAEGNEKSDGDSEDRNAKDDGDTEQPQSREQDGSPVNAGSDGDDNSEPADTGMNGANKPPASSRADRSEAPSEPDEAPEPNQPEVAEPASSPPKKSSGSTRKGWWQRVSGK